MPLPADDAALLAARAARPPYRVLVWLALASFTTGIDGYVIAGLLPDISSDLAVTPAVAGQLLSVFAITSAVGGPLLGALTGGWERRRTLCLALATFVIGNVITAVAPVYPVAVAGRITGALGACLLTAGLAAVAAELSPPQARGRALSFILGGWMAATALGVPIGLVLGQASWRFPLIMVAILGALALVGLRLKVPQIHLPPMPLRMRLRPLLDGRLVITLLVTTGILWASYTTFTYATLILGPTHREPWMIIVIMFGYGMASMAGNAVTGRLADRFPPVAVLTVMLALLLLVALPGPWAVAGPVISLCWFFAAGIGNGGAAVPQQARLVALAPQSATVVLALNASAISLGAALGGATGGLTLQHTTPPHLLWVAAVILAGTLVVHGVSWLVSRNKVSLA